MAPYSIQIVAEEKCFNGIFRKFSHFSKVLDCEMKCSVFLPPKALDAEDSEDVPVFHFADLSCCIFCQGLHATKITLLRKRGRCSMPRGLILPWSALTPALVVSNANQSRRCGAARPCEVLGYRSWCRVLCRCHYTRVE